MKLNENLFDDIMHMAVPDAEASIEVVETTPSTPKVGEDTGVADLLMDLIKDEYEAIQGYNTFLANLNGHEEMKPIIEDIVAEENTHIGQLQELLKTISPNVSEIDTGTAEAQEQLNAKDYPLDESLNEDETGSNGYWDLAKKLEDYLRYNKNKGLQQGLYDALKYEFNDELKTLINSRVDEVFDEQLKLRENTFMDDILHTPDLETLKQLFKDIEEQLHNLYSLNSYYQLDKYGNLPAEVEEAQTGLYFLIQDLKDELKDSGVLTEGFIDTILNYPNDRHVINFYLDKDDIRGLIENMLEFRGVDYELTDEELDRVCDELQERGMDSVQDNAWQLMWDDILAAIQEVTNEVHPGLFN